MTRTAIGRLCLASALAIGASGCALLPHHAKWARITPIKPAATTQVASNEGYYQSAVAAVDRRDYARALEELQVARQLKADDVRVLNAFGVVYDKLGRFDLSARYYTQALALDPNSKVVSRNMAYSALMQGHGATAALTALAVAAPPPAPARTAAPAQQAMGRVVAVGPGVVRLEPPRLALAQSSAPGVIMLGARAPVLTGRPLVLVNATGRAGGAEPMRLELARRGWTAPRSASVDGPREALTTIRYAYDDLVAAKALARTLPAPVRLMACSASCDGLRLVIGADATGWPTSARRTG